MQENEDFDDNFQRLQLKLKDEEKKAIPLNILSENDAKNSIKTHAIYKYSKTKKTALPSQKGQQKIRSEGNKAQEWATQ